jgi:NADH dehydrogenase
VTLGKQKIATIFGGTGFVGRYIVRLLAKEGYLIKVATRIPERAYFLKPCGDIGQIVPFYCDYNNQGSIDEAVQNSDLVINCIGVLYQKRKSKFKTAHIDIPEKIAKACKKNKSEYFIHISSLGVDKNNSKYAKTKLEGEKAVKKSFKNVIIFRPSVVFGPEDQLFNLFAELSRYLPFLPLIGGGKTRFQPVYVGDIAKAVVISMKKENKGKLFELGGPEVVNFKEVYGLIFKHCNRKRALIPMPFWLAKFNAFFLGFFPKPLLTTDQVTSLKFDSVVGKKALGFSELGIMPKSLAMILPSYLERFCASGVVLEKNRA